MNKKRTRRLGIRLNEDEYIRLQNYMERTEMNASDLFRTFIRDNPIKEIPDKISFYQCFLLREHCFWSEYEHFVSFSCSVHADSEYWRRK